MVLKAKMVLLAAVVAVALVPGCKPEKLKATLVGSHVKLTWELAQSGNPQEAGKDEQFSIYRGVVVDAKQKISYQAIAAVPERAKYYVDKTANVGTTYFYYLQAAGGSKSNVVNVAVPVPPDARIVLSASATGPNFISLSWSGGRAVLNRAMQPGGAVVYAALERRKEGQDWMLAGAGADYFSGERPTFTDIVRPGTTYSYRLRYGAGTWDVPEGLAGVVASNVVTVTTPLK